MSRPLTAIYNSRRDYSSLPEVEVQTDPETDRKFDVAQWYLTAMIVVLIAAHVLFSLLCAD